MNGLKGGMRSLTLAAAMTACATISVAQIGGAIEGAARRAALTTAERQAAERAAKTAAESASRRAAAKTTDHVVRQYTTSLCKTAAPCPLPEQIGERLVGGSFKGGSYQEVILGQDTVLYRAIHDPSFKFGDPRLPYSFWSRSNATGIRATTDSAIPVTSSGNTAERLVAIRVPRGTRVFEGIAHGEEGSVGGGNQVVVRNVNPKWSIDVGPGR